MSNPYIINYKEEGIKLVKTFISSRGTRITINIPDRTPEEQAIRDKQIEHDLRAIYKRLEAEGKADIFKQKKEVS